LSADFEVFNNFYLFNCIGSDLFIVIACDGIWDVMTNDEVVAFLAEKLGFTSPSISTQVDTPYKNDTTHVEDMKILVAKSCDELIKECFLRNSTDNMSVLVVLLQSNIGVMRSMNKSNVCDYTKR